MAAAYVDDSGDLNTVVADGFVECPDATTAYLVAGASVPPSPEDEACVRSVVEANPDAVKDAFVDAPDTTDGPDPSDDLDALIAGTCPTFDVIIG